MDKYDVEINCLVKSSGNYVESAWESYSALFKSVDPTCGCLTTIRGEVWGLVSYECPQHNSAILAIHRDIRIPASYSTPNGAELPDGFCEAWDAMSLAERRELLTIFAEWQRALDATIRAGRPWHDDFTPRRAVDAPAKDRVPV